MFLLIRILAICIFIQNGAHATTLMVDKSITNGESVRFLEFFKPTQWGSWLQMNLPYEPIPELLRQTETSEKIKLISRDEAHITVITPVEYWNVLKPVGISMHEINEIARASKIQSSKFEITCLGKGTAKIDNKEERTYYLVVHSEDLLRIRSKIFARYIEKGGLASAFNPKNYHPHITLGFTKRDLHESDYVVKDSASCVHDIFLK